uniref:Putative hydrolase n=1 Tax=Diffractella curvata TaxID=2819868 RepID=A0A7R6QQ92_9PEZI|nr:ZopR1 [Diffractella curvata]BBU42027.1 putative hydrolase [Diffractella curvata]
MPTLKFLCLHGAGTNAQILGSQLGPLMRELGKDNSAIFHLVEGDVGSPPGPGIEGFYEGPFFSYYKWPRTFNDNDESIMEAYDMLYEVIEEEGPFDGILGFSHGGTLATGFLAHHATLNPYDPPLFRCAVFFSSLAPFRMNDDETPVFEEGLEGKIKIPTLHVMGTKDFIYSYSLHLFNLCDVKSSAILVHDRGHEIPSDGKTLARMAAAFRDLGTRSMFL